MCFRHDVVSSCYLGTLVMPPHAVALKLLTNMYAFVATILCVIAIFVFMKLTNAYAYWNKKGINGPEPKFLFGNFKTLLTKEDSVTSLAARFYKQYKDEELVGLYQGLTPMLLVRDAELIKKVLVKDFSSFTDRGFRLTNEPLSRNLFSLDGEEWKILRQKLTPLFSNSKLKNMIPLLNSCVKDFVTHLEKLTEEQIPREVRTLNMKYTLKAITSVAFGLDIDTFTDEKSQFIAMAEALFRPRSMFRRIVVVIDGLIPGIFRKIPVSFAANDISTFFLNLVKGIVKEREGKPKVRKDFMDLMIELKEQGTVSRSIEEGGTELEVTDEFITAQALLFYGAGFETSSSTMSFMLYELAYNQDVQDRCHEEIKKCMKKCNGELTYEAINELEYVSMAFDEALRKHPVAGVLIRQCVREYDVPELGVTVDKGTKILISVMGLHYDSRYYPEPEKFDPERFSAERKNSIPSGTYLPFGDGPRNCAGLRLAKVQSLLGIAHFLYHYRVTPSEKTPRKIRYDPLVIILKSIDGIWLNIQRRA